MGNIDDGLSRQRRWQLKQCMQGNCETCGKKAVKHHLKCAKCAKKLREYLRKKNNGSPKEKGKPGRTITCI